MKYLLKDVADMAVMLLCRKTAVRAFSAFCIAFFSWTSIAVAGAAPTEVGATRGGETARDWPGLKHAPKGAPNIVVIMLDDVGFGASSTFGGAAQTPVLDRLAARGLRYNNFYTTGLCSPSRASLLTGRNHHVTGFGTVIDISQNAPGYDGIWRRETASVARVLQQQGYKTAAFGKWHNTQRWEATAAGPFDRWPTGLGFDDFYGFMGGESSQWEPALYRDTTPVPLPKEHSGEYHFTTDIVNHAIGWIRTQQALQPDKPYFVYFAPAATHAPHHVPAQWIKRYQGRFDNGWDKLREEIFQRQKTLGVIPNDSKLTSRPSGLPAWESLSSDQQRLVARQMEVFSAYLAHTDHEIGRLLDVVQDGPQGENTLIFYIVGDNGGDASGGPVGSDNARTETLTGLSASMESRIRNMAELGGPLHDNNYAAAWAWATSTPFQGTKSDAAHLGGIRNPMVVSWPAVIKDHGGLRTQFTHINDVAATIYEAVGVEAPAMVDGARQLPLDGVSFLQTFASAQAPSKHKRQYFEMIGNRGIYEDGWFAGATHWATWMPPPAKDFSEDRWELYNLSEDYSQSNDLSEKYPEKLKAMKALFDEEARKNSVFPLIDPFKASMNLVSMPSSTRGRSSFTFYPGFPRAPTSAAPPLIGSHRITADMIAIGKQTQGVLLSIGGRNGGYILYVKDGKPVFENNFFGMGEDLVISRETLPAGPVQLVYEYEKQDSSRFGGGTGRMYINGRQVGEARIPRVGLPGSFGSFTIGEAADGPVSKFYPSPVRLNATLKAIRIDLLGDQAGFEGTRASRHAASGG